jgi:hypothetical protein
MVLESNDYGVMVVLQVSLLFSRVRATPKSPFED